MSNVKVSFYNPDTDTVLELILSGEDAIRAQNDITFATSVMQAALKDQAVTASVDPSITENLDPSITETPDPSITETSDPSIAEASDPSINTEEEAEDTSSLCRWNETSVLFLLENYREAEKKFTDGKQSHKKIWHEVAQIMQKKGHFVTGPQCAAKLRSLKKTFKAIKDHNKKSGNDRRTWQFFMVMDNIFSKKAWCNPIATRSSTGLATNAESNSSTEADSGCIYEPSTSKGKSSTIKLLTKRIHQKEEHEEAKKKKT